MTPPWRVVIAAAVAIPALALAGGKVIRYEDQPPSERMLHLSPARGTERAREREGEVELGVLGIRKGSAILLRANSIQTYDGGSGEVESLALTGAPEEVRGGLARAFTVGGDDRLHVFLRVGDDQPKITVATYDIKGRFEKSVLLALRTSVDPSFAVSATGDIFVSCLNAWVTGPPPGGPVSVFRKDGSFKRFAGEYESTSSEPLENGLRNLRHVVLDDQGRLYLVHRDRFQIESFSTDGQLLRSVSIAVDNGFRYHLPGTPPPVPAPETRAQGPERLSGGFVVPAKPDAVARKPAPEDDPIRKKGEAMTGGKGTFNRVEVGAVIRDVAFHHNRLYLLRNPTLLRSTSSPRAVIDVVDTFGNWEEQLVLEPAERFDRIAIDESGRIFAYAISGRYSLWHGDLSEQPTESSK